MAMFIWGCKRRYVSSDDLKVKEGYLENEMNRGTKQFWERRGQHPPYVESSRVEDMREFYSYASRALNWYPDKHRRTIGKCS